MTNEITSKKVWTGQKTKADKFLKDFDKFMENADEFKEVFALKPLSTTERQSIAGRWHT